jgi:hypothetical protein
MTRIEIRKANGAWVADHWGKLGEDVKARFGTRTLPTAFTEQAPEHEVVAELRRLNPGIRVVVRRRP